jgi:hypothetical protein
MKRYKLFDHVKRQTFVRRDIDFIKDCTKIQGGNIEKNKFF